MTTLVFANLLKLIPTPIRLTVRTIYKRTNSVFHGDLHLLHASHLKLYRNTRPAVVKLKSLSIYIDLTMYVAYGRISHSVNTSSFERTHSTYFDILKKSICSNAISDVLTYLCKPVGVKYICIQQRVIYAWISQGGVARLISSQHHIGTRDQHICFPREKFIPKI